MRMAHVVAVHWYSPMGQINGTVSWQDYRYASAKGGTVRNYPAALDSPGDLYGTAVAMAGSAANDFHVQMRRLAFRDLSNMRAAGFDNLLYDMLPSPNWTNAKTLQRPSSVADASFAEPLLGYIAFLQYVAAAELTGMTVAPLADIRNTSADYPGGHTLDTTEWTAVLQGALDNLPASSAVFKVGGVPVLAHFGSDRGDGHPPDPAVTRRDGGWLDVIEDVRDSGRALHFVADYRPNLSDPSVNQDWVTDPDPSRRANALYMFAPAGTEEFMRDYQHGQRAEFSVPRWWTVSPGYYNAAASFTQPSFSRIHETYLQAIADEIENLVVLTWNDFGEDTDIAPSANKGRCLTDIFAHYNEWFHTGREPAPRDQIVIVYPMRSPSSITTEASDYGPYGESPGFSPMKAHYWASLRAPARIVLAGGTPVTAPKGTSTGALGTVTEGRQWLSVNGKAMELSMIAPSGAESQRSSGGGLEHRYLDVSHLFDNRLRR